MAKLPRALNDTNRVVSWTIQGMMYGYPPCCVGEFVIHAIKGTYTKRGQRKLDGTGYVPCIKCNEKSTAELVAVIEERRHESNGPFITVVPKKSA